MNCLAELLFHKSAHAYKLTDETTVRTTVGKGFRSPTIRELYLFPAPTPTLQPEDMWNYELGVTQTIASRISLDLTGFVSEGKNIILTQGVYPNLTLSNSGSFIHRGVEFSGSAFISSDLHLQTSYSFIDAGKETRSVPKHKIFMGCDYTYRITTLSLSILRPRGARVHLRVARMRADCHGGGWASRCMGVAGLTLLGTE